MNDFPLYAAAFVVVLSVLIFFHELGHYLAARYCGVKVLRFSIGFGPVVWQRQFGVDRTEWALSLVPLGGYVKMLDEREGPVASSELSRAFNQQGVGARSLIVAAGPLANFLLAILLYWAVFMSGSHELLAIMGEPKAASPAAMAGIRAGEQVRAVDGESVQTWNQLRWSLLQKAVDHDHALLEVANEQQEIAYRTLSLQSIRAEGWEGEALDHLGLMPFRPVLPPVLGALTPGGPAEQAGLQPGDRVIAIDGAAIAAWHEVVLQVRRAPGRILSIEVERAGAHLSLQAAPEPFKDQSGLIGRLGVRVAEPLGGMRELKAFVRYDVITAAGMAIRETWEKSIFSLVMMGKMLLGEVSWRNLSGPVTIADYAGQSAKLGWDYYLKFMALVSISLGVLNLLPIPVLDGGHLMYHMIEVVRRRPLSERAMEIGQRIGLSLIFVLMAFAFFNDINRLVSG